MPYLSVTVSSEVLKYGRRLPMPISTEHDSPSHEHRSSAFSSNGRDEALEFENHHIV